MTFFRLSRSMRFVCAFSLLAGIAHAANAQASPSPAPPSATEKATPPQVSATAQTKPQLEPKAIEILKATPRDWTAAHSMEFTALETFESPSRLGFLLAYGTKSDVLLQRPDKLRVITFGDGPVSEFLPE